MDIRALMEGKITGVQVYIINLLDALFQIDSSNQYVLFANSFGRVERQVKLFEYTNVQYQIFYYPNKIFNLSQKYLGYPKVDRMIGGIDLFFSPHWRSISINDKIPLVVTFHDLSFELMPEFFTIRQRLWHRFMNYKQAAIRAKKIIAVSQNTKKDLVEIYKIEKAKIEVIYPGVTDPKLISNHNKPKKYFLYFGTFEPRKNIETVLAAYEKYLEQSQIGLPLVLAGSSGWKTKLRIPKKFESHISIFQNVDETKKTELYRNAFASLFVSFYEGFGFPILESAVHGVPVIASSSTSLLEIASNFSLFVSPFRSAQLSSAMLDLERDGKMYGALKNRGLQEVKKFSWKNCARQTLALFEELI